MVKERKRADKRADKFSRSPSTDNPDFSTPDSNAARQELSPRAAPPLETHLSESGLRKESNDDAQLNEDAAQYEEPILTKLIVER